MKTLLLLTLLFSQTIQAKIPHSALKFQYMSFEGDEVLNCKHNTIDEFEIDYDVFCGDSAQKKFRVHLALSRFERNSIPQNTYELLYWVTDYQTNPITNNGSSLWLNLREKTNFEGLTISQSVSKDTAGLYLTITAF
jgi:hypothetical protein